MNPAHLFKSNIFIIATLSFVVIFSVFFFTYYTYANDLATPERIMNKNSVGVILLDRKDRPFFSFYNANTSDEFVNLPEITKNVQLAVIASEDKEFYSHSGFSIRGILRSIFLDLKERSLSYGGSTITQQLVKNSLLNPKKDFIRKIQELILAREIEKRYTKDQILEMYLNSVYFGEGAFGIREAAQTYFGKKPSELTLSESSLLIGLIGAPTRLSPLNGDLNELKLKQQIVLREMEEEGYIDAVTKEKAEKEEIVLNPQKQSLNYLAPHFALMVRDELISRYGSEESISRSGFKVKTTIDLDKQEFAERLVAQQVDSLKANGVTNGAVVVMDPKSGGILSLVGSKDWYNEEFGKVNIALSLRQPGSAFKPLVYLAGFESEIITPATILKDEPTTYVTTPNCSLPECIYRPLNYDRKFRGKVLVRRALANSLNVPSVDVMSKVGIPKALEEAKKLGITTFADPSNYGLSLVLGAAEVKLLDLTSVYATFANQGLRAAPVSILEISDKYGNKIFSHTPSPERVVNSGYAFLISSILSDNNARREVFGDALTISRSAAVKTGTTENFRDAWTLGYTPSLAIGVWVGNNDGKPMDNIAGSLGAAPIWRGLMEQFLLDTPVEIFQQPSNVVYTAVCSNNGILTQTTTSPLAMEYFVRGTEPAKSCFVSTVAPTPSSLPTPTPTFTPSILEEPAFIFEEDLNINQNNNGRGKRGRN